MTERNELLEQTEIGIHPDELIKARTAENREQAKVADVKMGPNFKMTPRQQDEVRKRKAEGQSVRELGRSYDASANRSVESITGD